MTQQLTSDELLELLSKADSGPWKLHTVEIPHHLQNPRAPEPHYDRSIYTAWDNPQLKGPEPIMVTATGVPAVKGDPPVKFVFIDEANAKLMEMAPTLAAEVLALRAKNERLRMGLSQGLTDIELEEALGSEGIFVWGPDGERFVRMFAVVMKGRITLTTKDAGQ